MKNLALGLASALVVLLVSSTDVEARCMSRGLVFDRVGDGELAEVGAALLLGLRPGTSEGDIERISPTLRLVAAGHRHALAVETLAPGLVVARASERVPRGRYAVEGIAVDVTVEVGAAPAVSLAAPQVSRLVTTRGARGNAATRAELGAPVPAGAAAVIVLRDGRPIAWRPVGASEVGTTSVVVASTRRCMAWPTGYEVPAGDRMVTLRWVDARGGMSAESNAIGVVMGER